MEDIGAGKDNLIIISNIEWGYLKQRHQHLAIALKDAFNVVYIESTAKRNPGLKDIPRILVRLLGLFRKKKAGQRADPDSKGINIITPIVCPSTFRIFRLLNTLYFSRRLVRQIQARCHTGTRTVLFSYLPSSTVFDIIRLLDHQALVYDCVSNFAGVAGMPPDTIHLEKELIRQSAMVFTDCDYLYEKHRGLAKKIKLIEPGVDFALFNAIRGDSCRDIKKITYYGAISDKIDFDVLRYLLERGIEITMIGPIKFHHAVLDSVQYIPPVAHQDLPGRLADADALIIPYLDNTFMLGVIPAKFFECFATGKPVIATYSDNYKRYDNLIIQGKTPEEIYNRIQNIQHEESPEKQRQRLEIARKQDWQVLGRKVGAVLETVL